MSLRERRNRPCASSMRRRGNNTQCNIGFIFAPCACTIKAARMKFDSSSSSTPTPQQLTELNDALLSATELERLYAALARHPRVQSTPGSVEIFEACREQLEQDIAMLGGQLESMRSPGLSSPLGPHPDIEPANLDSPVFATVKKAFHFENFLRRQLESSLISAQERGHRRLELQLKMVLLSAGQRYRLLEERYGFTQSKSVIVQGLRRQTTRLLSRLQGEKRRDID